MPSDADRPKNESDLLRQGFGSEVKVAPAGCGVAFNCSNCCYLDNGVSNRAASTHPFQFCFHPGGPVQAQFGRKIPSMIRDSLARHMQAASMEFLQNPSAGSAVFARELSRAVGNHQAGSGLQEGSSARHYQASNVQPLGFVQQPMATNEVWRPQGILSQQSAMVPWQPSQQQLQMAPPVGPWQGQQSFGSDGYAHVPVAQMQSAAGGQQWVQQPVPQPAVQQQGTFRASAVIMRPLAGPGRSLSGGSMWGGPQSAPPLGAVVRRGLEVHPRAMVTPPQSQPGVPPTNPGGVSISFEYDSDAIEVFGGEGFGASVKYAV
jgi:hypothetical protein